MKKLTLYHNGGCSKSRAVLALLQDRSDMSLEIVEYLKTPPSPETLNLLLQQLGLELRDIVRDHEDAYDELGIAAREPLSRAQWLQILSEHPILIERPIISDGIRAVIGRPPENALKLLES